MAGRIATAVLILSLAAAPLDAAASSDSADLALPWVALASVAATSTVAFGVADLVYAQRGSWLSAGWAWPQIIVAGGSTLAFGVINLELNRGTEPAEAALSAVAFTVGAWFAIHGVISLVSGRSQRPIWAAIAPRRGGGVASLGGSF